MMKSRIGLLAIAVALLFAIAHAQDSALPAPTPAPRPAVGRYQLVPVEHCVIIGNQAPPAGAPGDQAVLRIDTATGVVDEWITGMDASGNSYNRWIRTGIK